MSAKDDNYVIYVDSDKCRGCMKCELACIASHNNMTIKEAIKMRKELASRVHVIKTDRIKMPVQCHQCEDAPCAAICPTQALVQRDAGKGKILMRPQYCAGCGLCQLACPYGAITRSFLKLTEEEKARQDASTGHGDRFVAVRCDLCSEWRQKEGKIVSACVETCPAGALKIIPVEEFRKIQHEKTISHDMFCGDRCE